MKVVKSAMTRNLHFFVINDVFSRVFVFLCLVSSFHSSLIDRENDIDRNNSSSCSCNDCNEFKKLSKFVVFESNVRIKFIDLKKKKSK